MTPIVAAIRFANALARPLEDLFAVKWIATWCEDRTGKLAHENGPPAVDDLCPRITEWVELHIPEGDTITVEILLRLEEDQRKISVEETGLVSWLCDALLP